MLKIIVIDDHPLVRRGIVDSIKDIPGFDIVGESGDAKDAQELLAKTATDIVILDISLPGVDGLELLKIIRSTYPTIKVLILTMHPEEMFALRAFRNGASGYLAKAEAPRELSRALVTLSQGDKYISRSMSRELIEHLDSDLSKQRFELLSDRELQVLIQIAKGLNNKSIAEKLALSTKTVSTYRTRVLAKMQMESDAQLTRYAVTNHLIE